MIERAQNPAFYQTLNSAPRNVLRMQQGERTAGSIPVWGKPTSAKEEIESNITAAQNPQKQGPDALAFQQNSTPVSEEFGFSDLLDMINPFQHIPIVNHFYRELTGDTIKPASQIIGGAVFGGALGAAGGLANVVIAEETGGSVTENALAFAKSGKVPNFKHTAVTNTEARTATYAPKAVPNAIKASWSPSNASSISADYTAALLAFDSAKAAQTKPSQATSFTLNV